MTGPSVDRLPHRLGSDTMEVQVTHEMLAILLVVVVALILATFAWMVYLTRDIGRMVKAVAAMVYQEAEKTRASLPTRER